MKKSKLVTVLVAAAFAVSLSLATGAMAQLVINPGVDLWETPSGGSTVIDYFTVTPIPADFFGPGSDPFDAPIALQGVPLSTVPPGALGTTDVIVERLAPATLPSAPSSDMVPIEIIALSLKSISPITVTYDGGGGQSELWDVEACLSSVDSQLIGSMTINRDCNDGGSFFANLPVTPKLTFTRVDPPAGPTLVIDPANTDMMITSNGRWSTYVPPPFALWTSPGVLADHDCDPITPDVVVPPSSGNFFPGMTLEPCDPANPEAPPTCGGKVLTKEEAQLALHGVLPPQQYEPQEGACCLPDDRCIIVTPECCDSLGGDYQGDFTSCFPDPCTTCCNTDGIRGDVNGDGELNVADLTCIVCYAFLGCGPPQCCACPEECDINGDGSFNIADLTYLVDYLFRTGPPPAPC